METKQKDEFAALAAAWISAYKAQSRGGSQANYEDEDEAWDALVEYVEAHDLNDTDQDPRRVGFQRFASRFSSDPIGDER